MKKITNPMASMQSCPDAITDLLTTYSKPKEFTTTLHSHLTDSLIH